MPKYQITIQEEEIINDDWESESSTTFHTAYTGRTELINGIIEENEGLQKELKETKKLLEEAEKRLAKFNGFQEEKNKKIKERKIELEELYKTFLVKGGNCSKEKLQKNLSKLSKAHINIVYSNDDGFLKEIKEEASKSLLKKTLLTSEEIDKFCQLHEKIYELQLELGTNKWNIRDEKERITVINNSFSGTVNIEQGHMFMGNVFDDGAEEQDKWPKKEHDDLKTASEVLRSQDINHTNFLDNETKEKEESNFRQIVKPTKALEIEKSKIPTLEKEIQILTNIIKKQKEKIFQAYLFSFSENEQSLVKELIEAHLRLIRAKERRLPSLKFRNQFYKIYNELIEKIGEKEMEKTEIILKDFEELIHYESELVQEINKNQQVLEEAEQQINDYIAYLNTSIDINQGHLLIGNVFGDNADFSQNQAQVGNISIEHSRFASSVAIGVGQITNQQAQTLQPPKNPL